MIRVLLFALPFVAFYFLMKYLKARKREDREEEAQIESSIGHFAMAGIALLLAVFGYMAFFSEDTRGVDYVPPQEIDGEIKPGHIEKKDPEGQND